MTAATFLGQPFARVALAITASADYREGRATYKETQARFRFLARHCTLEEIGGVFAIWKEIEKQ